jgi:hypothetical protein
MYPTSEQLEERWWHRLVKVLIIFATVVSFIFAIRIFLDKWESLSPHFLLSFEDGYNEINAKEQKLEDCPSSIEFDVIDKIKYENPPVLSKNSFDSFLGSRGLYPREFIETQCDGGLFYSSDCLGKIAENYPEWKIKIWKDYSVF